MSVRLIATELGRSRSATRALLARLGLETRRIRERREARAARSQNLTTLERWCPHHGQATYTLEKRGSYRCVQCRSEGVARRRRDVKRILAEEAGGRCVICGYTRFVRALQFHHLRRMEKRFALSDEGVTRSLDAARREASKCVLVCANCHAEVEAGIVALPAELPVASNNGAPS